MTTPFSCSRKAAMFAAIILLSSVALPLRLNGQTSGAHNFIKQDPIRVYVDPWTANSPTVKECLSLLRNDAAFEIVESFHSPTSAGTHESEQEAHATYEPLLSSKPILFRELLTRLRQAAIPSVRVFPAGERTASALLTIYAPKTLPQGHAGFYVGSLVENGRRIAAQFDEKQDDTALAFWESLYVIVHCEASPDTDSVDKLYRIKRMGIDQLFAEELEELRRAKTGSQTAVQQHDPRSDNPSRGFQTLAAELPRGTSPGNWLSSVLTRGEFETNKDADYWENLLTASEIQTATKRYGLQDSQLRRFLKAAFNAKHLQLLHELQQLQSELEASEQEIAIQFSQSDAIIANRLAKLLDPSANSNNPPTIASNPLELTAGNSTAESINLLPKTPSATVQSLDWSSPVDLVTKISEIRIAQKTLPEGETIIRAEYQKYLEALMIAFESHVMLSQKDLEFAQKKFALVREDFENVMKVYKSGALSAAEQNQKKLELTESENELLRAETRYRSIRDLLKQITDQPTQ